MTYHEFLAEWHDTGDTIMCHTSGSTGSPKTIMLPKKEVSRSACRTISFFSLNDKSHLHSCISPNYIGGKMMAVRADLCRGNLSWEEPSNRTLENYNGDSIDLLAVVPSQMLYIIENLDRMPIIRNIIIGGAKIDSSLRSRIAETGLNAWETYGMTETASHIALRKVAEIETNFMPLPGIEIDVDEQRKLIIDMKDWKRIVTNDIVELKTDGSFKILGRSDNVINSGGKKIHPEAVEEVLENIFGCEILITSKPDIKWGEQVVMIIDDGLSGDSDNQILETCRNHLTKECVPKSIIHSKIKHTPNGKKQR